MTPELKEAEYRARLVALGLKLDEKAFAATWVGAQHLRAEVAKVEAYLARPE